MSAIVIDKTLVMERLGGDEELFVEMAQMYVDEAANYANDLLSALQAEDAVRLQREAHTIKGLLATFADDAGVEMAIDVERRARQGEVTSLGGEVANLKIRVLALAEALSQGV